LNEQVKLDDSIYAQGKTVKGIDVSPTVADDIGETVLAEKGHI